MAEDTENGDIGLVSLAGRPRKYETPEEFDEMVDKYYQHCIGTNEPITWTGLALYLGFYGRKEIDNYLEYEGFSHSVKRAKSLVEYGYEKLLHRTSNAAAPIFALKNFGWSDKSEEAEPALQPLSINISVNEPVNEVKVTRGESKP